MNKQKYRVVRYQTTVSPEVDVVGAQQVRTSREVVWSAPELPSLKVLSILSRARVAEMPELDEHENNITLVVQERRQAQLARLALPWSRYVKVESYRSDKLAGFPDNS